LKRKKESKSSGKFKNKKEGKEQRTVHVVIISETSSSSGAAVAYPRKSHTGKE
jgi:hypothetical protein